MNIHSPSIYSNLSVLSPEAKELVNYETGIYLDGKVEFLCPFRSQHHTQVHLLPDSLDLTDVVSSCTTSCPAIRSYSLLPAAAAAGYPVKQQLLHVWFWIGSVKGLLVCTCVLLGLDRGSVDPQQTLKLKSCQEHCEVATNCYKDPPPPWSSYLTTKKILQAED